MEGVLNTKLSISECVVEQLVDRVVDVPVVLQRRAPTIQRVEKTGEVSHVQCNDKVVNVLAVTRRLVPAVQAVQKAAEVAQVRDIDKIADALARIRDSITQGCRVENSSTRMETQSLNNRFFRSLLHYLIMHTGCL